MSKFPGALDKFIFDVMMATSTVPILLSLNSLEDTTTTGHRQPGSEPLDSSSIAHLMSPLCITNLLLEWIVIALIVNYHLRLRPHFDKLDSIFQ